MKRQQPNPQAAHYESVHDEYSLHYYDAQSMRYRREFVYDVAFADYDFNHKVVADLACGSGYNSLALMERFPEVRTVGFDISPKACLHYQQVTGNPAMHVDLTRTVLRGPQVDAAMVFGGLHHCVADLPAVFRNICEIVKPGGILIMWEPNRRYAFEFARKLWYRVDRYFEESTEAALDHDELVRMTGDKFTVERIVFRGGPAYFLTYNSLIFRVPPSVKRAIAPALVGVERLYNVLPGKVWYPYFVARWLRRP